MLNLMIIFIFIPVVFYNLMFFSFLVFFFFNDTATTEIYTLSLHDALPILLSALPPVVLGKCPVKVYADPTRSEEHTSELQSHVNIVCRLLLEKKKNKKRNNTKSRQKYDQMNYSSLYYNT